MKERYLPCLYIRDRWRQRSVGIDGIKENEKESIMERLRINIIIQIGTILDITSHRTKQDPNLMELCHYPVRSVPIGIGKSE
jgi:hypothetical protein